MMQNPCPMSRTLKNAFTGDYKEYSKTVSQFFDILFKKMVITGDKFVLPSALGVWQICKYLPKRKHRNWGLEKKLGKSPIYYSNLHSDGYGLKFLWSKYGINFKLKQIWAFDLLRGPKRRYSFNLKDYVMTNGLDHFKEI